MARAKFGGVTQIKESLRDQMGFPMLYWEPYCKPFRVLTAVC